MIHTYHGKPDLKTHRIACAMGHIQRDELIQFIYRNFAGCGCSVGMDCESIGYAGHDYHEALADFYGTPVWLERMRDTVFDMLPMEAAKAWHVDLTEATPIGSDLAGVVKNRAIFVGVENKVYEGDYAPGSSAERIMVRLVLLTSSMVEDAPSRFAGEVLRLLRAIPSTPEKQDEPESIDRAADRHAD